MVTLLYITVISLLTFIFVYLTYKPKCEASADRYLETTPIDIYTYDDKSCEEINSVENMETKEVEDSIEDEELMEYSNNEEVEPTTKQDDLTQIKGIGSITEGNLNNIGINTFLQIANWSDDDAKEVNKVLSFSGRIAREKWIEQAKSFISAKIED